mgnify:CR=1 FL=1
MSKSNIILAVIAGAVVGGIIAIVLKTEDALFSDEIDEEKEKLSTRTENIARQFSEKISSDLKAAEHKLKSAVKKDTGLTKPQGEFGVFL